MHLKIIHQWSIILIACLSAIFCLLFMPVYAEAACVDDLVYEISDGEVTITDCRSSAAGALEIPSTIEEFPVTGIANEAFSACSWLTVITIPDSVTSIGVGAFRYCSDLTSVTFGDGVEIINNDAFSACKSLTRVVIPDGVTVIASGVFAGCTALNSIVIPEGVTQIGWGAFDNCTSLTSITIPNSVTYISSAAFSGCSSLQSITIPFVGLSRRTASDITQYPFGVIFGPGNSDDYLKVEQSYYGSSTTQMQTETYYIPKSLTSVTVTGGEILCGAFSNCSNLTNVTIQDGATMIGDYAFSGCSSLTEISIPDSVTSIGKKAFSNCQSLTEISIPDGVTSIGSSAFSSCKNLTEVSTPNSVTVIGSMAFADCSKLTEITIPSGQIGDSAFSWCSSLNTVTMLDGVTGIGSSTFFACSSLESMTIPFVGKSKEMMLDTWQYPFGYLFGTRIYTGGIATKQYHYAPNTGSTSQTTYYIPKSLKSVTVTGGDLLYGAFYNCTGLKNITIGESVTQIGDKVFGYCSSLDSVTFTGDTPSFHANSFSNVETTVYFPACQNPWEASVTKNYGGTLTWVGYGHEYESVSIAPSCTEDINYTYACLICGNIEIVTIPATGHNWCEWVKLQEPTCTQTGLRARLCACGAQESESIPISATKHSWSDWNIVRFPSCTQNGVKEKICNCGARESVTIATLAHSWGDWMEQPAATCTTDGQKTRFCNCGAEETMHVAAYGHSYASVVTAPTCTEKGYTTYRCSNCGDTYADGYTSAIGHNYSVTVKTLTCTEDGATVYTCSRCRDCYMENVVKASGHKWSTWITLTEAGCTTTGKQSRFCSCGEKEYQTILPLGHSYMGDRCDICGAEYLSKVKWWNIGLGNEVAVYFEIAVKEAILENTTICVTVANQEKTYDVSKLDKIENGNYRVTVLLSAAQMTCPIQIQTFVSGDLMESTTYSVRQYADYILDDANGYTDSTKELVKHMLNYGAAAQIYFDVNTDNLANTGIDLTVAEVPVIHNPINIAGNVNHIRFYGVTLMHCDTIAIRFYFDAKSIANITFTVNESRCAPVVKDGLYYVEHTEIQPQFLDQPLMLIVSDGTDSMTVLYRPLDYILRMYNGDTVSDNTKDLVQALYSYHIAAKKYLAT